jgi:3-hydroxyisobutyrate dehydrogenase
MKLAINLPLLVFWQAFGEAFALCRHLGLDTKVLVDLFADTSGGPNVLKVRGPNVAAALAGGDAGPATFNVDSIRKDLRTMLAEGKTRGIELPLVAQTLRIFDEASGAGLGDRDAAVLPAYWSSRAPT